MQAIFNQKSFSALESHTVTAIENSIAILVNVCQKLQAMDSNFRIRINEGFWHTALGAYGTLNDIDDIDERKTFLYAITDTPFLPDDEIDTDDDKFVDESLSSSNTNIDDDCGIRVAYAFSPNPAPIISFANGEWENIDKLEIRSTKRNPISILNIATEKQLFEVHFEAIATQHLDLNTAKPNAVKVEKILPNIEITNLYIHYHALYESEGNRKKLKQGIPIKAIKDIGSLVAKINGWEKHKIYSKINKREVFVHQQSKTLFLAIDTEKGDFEVHNSNKANNHLGAISFDGAKTEPPKSHVLKFE